MKAVRIGTRLIGPGHPCFIIAEAGVNHNGSVNRALKLVDAAADAGADAVKFQTFTADKLVTADADQCDYQVQNIGKTEGQLAMLKRLELPYAAHRKLQARARKRGIIFLSTPFDDDAIDFLAKLDVPAFKAGSSDADNVPALRKMLRTGKPVIISSGMSDLAEMQATVDALKKYRSRMVLLHCTTEYPCPPEAVNLRAMDTLRDACGVLTGYSDHTDGITVPVAAAARGAVVIEKHLTLSRRLAGPDHKASLTPAVFKRMVDAIRLAEQALGTGTKRVAPSLRKNATILKKSIHAARKIRTGKKITAADLVIKRPADGLPPAALGTLVGATARRTVPADAPVRTADILKRGNA